MKSKKQLSLENKIAATKQSIQELGDIRPGSLSKQIAGGPGRKPRQYWQLSYTYKMRSRTDYIQDQLVEQIKNETLEYKKLKKLMENLIEFSIQLSKEKIEIFKKSEKEK